MWPFKKKETEATVLRKLLSIRMEAIGGQGANSAGKILAEAAVLGMGYAGNHFSSFGSEKRGSPVRSFVRVSTENKPVRTASYIKHPDILVVFHESLLDSHNEITDGATASTELIINSKKDPQNIRLPYGLKLKRVTTIDATTVALKSKCGLNAVMLAAIVEACPEIKKEKLAQTLTSYFSGLSEIVRKNNLDGFEAAFKYIKSHRFSEDQCNREIQTSPLPEMGWINAPIGGVIINPGNSALKDHSASRKGYAPLFTKELCYNCGFCDMVCPDYCFVWDLDPTGAKAPALQGIDYQYCKGCQKCVTVCPVSALTLTLESEIPEESKMHRVFSNLNAENIEKQWKKLSLPTYAEKISKNGDFK
ncbi:MAG: 2-oxoacid:acceptor oxidoreductase family protein [Bdellovibrionaceae bacterium]|nr:2-oxoacid:acceptor oxidoreductase family protein [Pseudobdellovibrionaceae bacterium]